MKFNSKHGDATVVIEYDEQDAAQSHGQVYQCEVTYNGQIVTPLVISGYMGFLLECERHFADFCRTEREISECAL